jgi:5-methylcytosine-specific restriction endonuclease McrA
MPTINKSSPRRPWQAERKPFQRMKVDNDKFYNSTAWRKFSIQQKKEFPLCDNFDTCGGVHEITDHPVPISEGGALFNQRMNHFCKACNASKTGKQAHKGEEI